MKSDLGCSFWLISAFLALFAGEWLFLWMAVRFVPERHLVPVVLTLSLLTIIAGAGTLWFRIQRRLEE